MQRWAQQRVKKAPVQHSGNWGVQLCAGRDIEALHVLGSNLLPSRRIDDQIILHDIAGGEVDVDHSRVVFLGKLFSMASLRNH